MFRPGGDPRTERQELSASSGRAKPAQRPRPKSAATASGDGRVCRALARAVALVKHRETARPIGENVLVVGLNVLFAVSTDNR